MARSEAPAITSVALNLGYAVSQVHKSFEDNFWATKMALKVQGVQCCITIARAWASLHPFPVMNVWFYA
jgi:hypothetical protein